MSEVSILCGLCEGPCFSRSTLHSALPTEKWTSYNKYETTEPKRRKLLTIHQGRQQLSFLLLANGTTQGHHLMTSGTNHSGNGIGHELICKETKMVKTWKQLGTILVNSSLEHKNYHHQIPALITPCFDRDCGQPEGHHAGAPSQRYQAPGNNNVTPPQMPISLHASRPIFVSGYYRNSLGIT